MSYNKEDLEHKALVAIKKHNILYIKEVVKYLPCSRSTFYNLKLDQSTLLNDFLFRSKKTKKTECAIKISANKYHKKINQGYVYVVQYNNENIYKIGVSKNNPAQRLASLQSGCPYELKFIHIEFCDNYYDLEKKLHLKYIKFRIRGEWFKLSDKKLNKLISSIEKNTATQLSLF